MTCRRIHFGSRVGNRASTLPRQCAVCLAKINGRMENDEWMSAILRSMYPSHRQSTQPCQWHSPFLSGDTFRRSSNSFPCLVFRFNWNSVRKHPIFHGQRLNLVSVHVPTYFWSNANADDNFLWHFFDRTNCIRHRNSFRTGLKSQMDSSVCVRSADEKQSIIQSIYEDAQVQNRMDSFYFWAGNGITMTERYSMTWNPSPNRAHSMDGMECSIDNK